MNRIQPASLILFLLALTPVFGCGGPRSATSNESRPVQAEKSAPEEASMNFDLDNVRPFLQRLKPLVESGFSDSEILQVQRMMESLKVGEEKELEFPIQYHGNKSSLRIRVFMDDVNAPDVSFFTDSKLAQEIDREMKRFADDAGI